MIGSSKGLETFGQIWGLLPVFAALVFGHEYAAAGWAGILVLAWLAYHPRGWMLAPAKWIFEAWMDVGLRVVGGESRG